MDEEQEMLLDAIKEIMGAVTVPKHAMKRHEMVTVLRERGYVFTDYRFNETLATMVGEGKVTKRRSGRQTYYWFVDDE